MHISLLYLANFPFPIESDSLLSNSLTLEYCENLIWIFNNYYLKVADKEDLHRAVCHIHACMVKCVEFVRWSCENVADIELSTARTVTFDIPNVVKTLKDLAKSCEASSSVQVCGIRGMLIMIHS